jgi:hypothetical protein
LDENGELKFYKKQISEDLLFFERVSRLWYKLYADTDICCNHVWLPNIVEVGDFTFVR